MRSRRFFALVLAAAALAGLLAWRGTAHETSRTSTTAAATGPAAQLAAVERVVAERNQKVGQEEKVFEADGWKMVDAPAPDPRVVALDPSLIAEGREAELNIQVGSVSPSKNKAHKLAQIILLAKEPATREHAADALGRIRTPEAAGEIVDLLTSGKIDPEDLGRRQLAALLKPVDLDDGTAARMAGLLDSDKITPVEKDQIAFTLALVGLRDGMQLPDDVLATLSPEARAKLVHMTDVAQRPYLAGGHVHSAHKD